MKSNKHRGFTIKPKLDFGKHGFYRAGKTIKEGWVVTDRHGCNAMPGACWFETVEEARHGVNVWLRCNGDADKFWEIMQPFEFKSLGQKADFESGTVTKGRFKAVIENFRVVELFSNCATARP